MEIIFPTPKGDVTLSDDPSQIKTYIAHMAKPGGQYIHDIEIFPRAEQGNYSGEQVIIPEGVIVNDVTSQKLDRLPIGLAGSALCTIRIDMAFLRRVAADYMSKGDSLSDDNMYAQGLDLEKLRQYILHPNIYTDYTYDFNSEYDISGVFEIEVFNTFYISDNYGGEYKVGKDSDTYGMWPIGFYSQGPEMSRKISGTLFKSITEFKLIGAAETICKNIDYAEFFSQFPREQIINDAHVSVYVKSNIMNFWTKNRHHFTRENDRGTGGVIVNYYTSLFDHSRIPLLIFLDIYNKMIVHSKYTILTDLSYFPTYDVHRLFKHHATGGANAHLGAGNPIGTGEEITNVIDDVYILSEQVFPGFFGFWMGLPEKVAGGFYEQNGNGSIYDYDNYYEYLKEQMAALGILGTSFFYSLNLSTPEPTHIIIGMNVTPGDYGAELDISEIVPESDEFLETGYEYTTAVKSTIKAITGSKTTEVKMETVRHKNGKTFDLPSVFHNSMNNNISDYKTFGSFVSKYDRNLPGCLQLLYKHPARNTIGDYAAVCYPTVLIGTCDTWDNPDNADGVLSDTEVRGIDFQQTRFDVHFLDYLTATNDPNDPLSPNTFSKAWSLRIAKINYYGTYLNSLALMLLGQFARENQTLIRGKLQNIIFGYTSNFVAQAAQITDNDGNLADSTVNLDNTQHLFGGITDWGNRTTEFEVFVRGDAGDEFYKKFNYPIG